MDEPREKRRRRRVRRRRPNPRAVYLLPNLVTSAALLLGFWSIVLATQGAFERAALCIVLAGVCDMLDGRIARATKSTSPFGVQYDSLSDLVSFGLAPAMLMYLWALAPLGRRGWLIAAMFVLCAALRLARFTVRAHESDSPFYQGLPSTAAGNIVAYTVWFVTWVGLEPPFGTFVGAAMTTWFAALAVLMVSSVPYASLKLVRVEGRRAYPTLVGIILFTIALLLNHEWMFFSLGVVFVASGPAYAWYRWRTKAEEPVSAEGSGERFDG